MSHPSDTGSDPPRRRTAAADAADHAPVDQALLQTALEHMPHGLCVFGTDDRLLLANQRYLDIWQLDPALGVPGTPFSVILEASRATEVPAHRAAVPREGGSVERDREWELDDGRIVRVSVTRLADGSCVALHEDVTAQRRAERQVRYLAHNDPLTGLANRAVLRETLAARSGEPGVEFALLCLDLDRFKAVNDRHGHPCGDRLLCEVAERLRGCAGERDLVVRLGGDEFAVVQSSKRQPEASRTLGRRIVEALSREFDLAGPVVRIGTSIGIALAPFDGEDPDTLLNNADLALYKAKAEGRGTLRFFESGMDARALARSETEAALRNVLVREELEVHYQVQVAAADGSLSGAEALLRWNHPERGQVVPLDFVPIAEESGLITPIGGWMLRRACRDAYDWPQPIRVAVNVSPVQFRDGRLLGDVEEALADSGLPAGRLELEITESTMLDDCPRVLEQLHALRERGIHIAIDDFGTGYSSLATLRRFPFSRIKIDRSLVWDVHRDPRTLAVLRAVMSLASSLGVATTVEGVEDEEQLAAVRAEGCSDVQGYLFGRPCPARELVSRMLAAGQSCRRVA